MAVITDPLDVLLGYQLRRASAVIMADFAASLATLALRPTEASILMVIAANNDAIQSDIGRLLGIHRANMTPLVAGLVRRGFIARDALDGRSHGLRLSPDGLVLADQVRVVIIQHEARFLPDVAHAERAKLIAHLQAVRAAGDALDA